MKSFEADRHGGNLSQLSAVSGRAPQEITDFSANINPLGFPEWVRPLISASISTLVHYPDPASGEMTAAVCSRYDVDMSEVICVNGTAEAISLLPAVAGLTHAVIPVPAYVDYAHACTAAKMTVFPLHLAENDDFALDFNALSHMLSAEPVSGRAMVFICRPNNPTGKTPDAERIRKLARDFPQSLFVIDEAFGDFVEEFESLVRNRPKNVLVLLSLTKIFALPGLRMGAAIADPALIEKLFRTKPCWSVNTLSQVVAACALCDHSFIDETRAYVTRARRKMMARLEKIKGLFVYPGDANFLLVRIERSDMDALWLAKRLLNDGIAIRTCDTYEGLDNRFFRVAVRTHEENGRLIDALAAVLNIKDKRKTKKYTHTPSIMFQGTGSNAGKSILAAALCRILHQDGIRVAPFKAQNMSLNSFVTRAGLEMGRAQVVQAQAARIEPDIRMNPILLKPSSDTGSQVIVNGFPMGNMKAKAYLDYKKIAVGAVEEAYDSLCGEFEAIVLEGAGSPGEVNLKKNDIVNMRMARYAKSPVLIVGDIDRGGVFASFVGTMEVLAQWERSLVSGFIVNKFRGDAGLLGDALDYTQRHTGRPVIGVVPYIHTLGLPDEDSVSMKDRTGTSAGSNPDHVKIGVVDLPHISNFTDFDPFLCEDDVSLSYIRQADEMEGIDAIILPGSKNVMTDVMWLRQNGMAARICKAAEAGNVEVAGICGGFQILGHKIEDPHCIESNGKTVDGLGLLDVTTVLEAGKTLTRTTATHLASGLFVSGYEIHHGVSRFSAASLLEMEDGRKEGAYSEKTMTWGTYLHGIFDSDPFRRWFVNGLRQRKGLVPKDKVCGIYDLEPAFDRLADTVRKSLDMTKIYQWMGG